MIINCEKEGIFSKINSLLNFVYLGLKASGWKYVPNYIGNVINCNCLCLKWSRFCAYAISKHISEHRTK